MKQESLEVFCLITTLGYAEVASESVVHSHKLHACHLNVLHEFLNTIDPFYSQTRNSLKYKLCRLAFLLLFSFEIKSQFGPDIVRVECHEWVDFIDITDFIFKIPLVSL